MTDTTVVDSATRVALLARPGIACDRLSAALQQAGAEVVLVADPSEADVAGVRASGAQAILVALEPLVEDVLDRYDALLADPEITVIFDEAELAAKREGWDAARWTRHLAAKLRLHRGVLPPGTESDGDFQWEAPDRYQRPETDLELSTFAIDEALTVVDAIPNDHQDSALRFDDPNATFEPNLADEAFVSNRFQSELADVQLRAAAIDLPGPAATDRGPSSGAVVVLAGIGGPDAVRQFLAAIPAGFPRPILIQQRLDGGQHEKLVRQMQRATKLPVCLAQVGEALQSGQVYILPQGMLPEPQDGELRFRQSDQELPAFLHLPPGDSAIVVLSGGDPGMVDAAMTHSWGGAMVAGQSPEGCFDGTAAAALLARGASSAAPADLAKRLSMRWLSLKD
jgi:chemosensory pili system protein ChpB (putative protein-glutamate methylesterase)